MEIKVIETIPDEFYHQIATFPQARIYHSKEWHRFLQTTFGWTVKAVIALENGKLVFFLPFVTKYRIDCKKHNICLPFNHSRVGPLYEDDCDINYVFQGNFPLTNLEIHAAVNHQHLHQTILNTVVLIDLKNFDHIDQLFKSFHKDSIQRKIIKAQRHGVMVKRGYSADDFSRFSEMAFETSLKHGVPAYPQSFFPNLRRCFQHTEYLKLYLAYYQGKAVAGVIFLHYHNVAIYAYGASLHNTEYFKLGVNQIVMWEAIKDAFLQNLEFVDFGKTPISFEQLLQYKLKWGGKSSILPCTYLKAPAGTLKRDSNGMKIASKLLQMMPTYIMKQFSPIILQWVI